MSYPSPHGPPPSEVSIFCCGQKTVAFLDRVLLIWKCARCGAKVKVAW